MQFFHYRGGLLLDVPLTLPGVTDPYLVLPHPEIERVIVETAQATGRVELRYRTRVVRLLENGGGGSGRGFGSHRCCGGGGAAPPGLVPGGGRCPRGRPAGSGRPRPPAH